MARLGRLKCGEFGCSRVADLEMCFFCATSRVASGLTCSRNRCLRARRYSPPPFKWIPASGSSVRVAEQHQQQSSSNRRVAVSVVAVVVAAAAAAAVAAVAAAMPASQRRQSCSSSPSPMSVLQERSAGNKDCVWNSPNPRKRYDTEYRLQKIKLASAGLGVLWIRVGKAAGTAIQSQSHLRLPRPRMYWTPESTWIL